MAKQREVAIFECEVERKRKAAAGGYEPFWKVKAVEDALVDEDSNFRCKDCGGAVKLHRRRAAGGPAPHAEHQLRADSEFCVAGMYFQQATDGRDARRSQTPVAFTNTRETRRL